MVGEQDRFCLMFPNEARFRWWEFIDQTYHLRAEGKPVGMFASLCFRSNRLPPRPLYFRSKPPLQGAEPTECCRVRRIRERRAFCVRIADGEPGEHSLAPRLPRLRGANLGVEAEGCTRASADSQSSLWPVSNGKCRRVPGSPPNETLQ